MKFPPKIGLDCCMLQVQNYEYLLSKMLLFFSFENEEDEKSKLFESKIEKQFILF